MDQNEADREVIEISEPTATAAKTQTGPRRDASLDRVGDKGAEAVRAKKKKKRYAHRVALRRSHTKG